MVPRSALLTLPMEIVGIIVIDQMPRMDDVIFKTLRHSGAMLMVM